MTLPRFEAYPFEITPLGTEDGGGYLITWPDLPGCMSDGETIEEAIRNGREAFEAWMQVCVEKAGRFPNPDPAASVADLCNACPKAEGVSMNTLAVTLLAEGLGRREGAGT